MAQSRKKYGETGSFSVPTKQTSMCSLIIWNISKALENNPSMDLRHAMRSAHERLERESRDESKMISQPAEERHLTCAILAWQQLGHKDTDSLYQFVEENRNKPASNTSKNSNKENIDSVNKAVVSPTPIKVVCDKRSACTQDVDFSYFDTNTLMGPAVKLPMETKIVMRVENSTCSRHSGKKITIKENEEIMNKIDAACCMDSVCVQRLSDLDKAVCELRSRAARLARREAERVELLERAEAAWKDLELGYQRRLNLAEEKEDDLARQIKNSMEERNSYKKSCTALSETLKERGETVEEERARLTEIEKELCQRACKRLHLSEEAARGESALAQQLCKSSQMDRDLQFKEDQVRRKVSTLESEIESARCLTLEAERAMRGELGLLKEQIANISSQVLEEESRGNIIRAEIEAIRKEKNDIIEDLDGCKLTCDARMQVKVDELKTKRDQLMELKNRVIECKCKLPINAAVEVKRTPSLAVLCDCTPEDKYVDPCSCTSLRSQLLSDLLADLFGGLQSELNGTGSLMPCQLLKCLEDKHNWDAASLLKSNLQNYFRQLLVRELDIAIATSIEKYHAKWVGASCADKIRTTCDPDEGWQERAIERRAQKLATQLAEQIFKERADRITQKAQEIVSKGPPPCECKTQPSVFPCLVKTTLNTQGIRKVNETTPSYLKRTLQDVTQLRVQIEDLKKESIKKEDLRQMEEKIARIVKRASKPDNIPSPLKKNKNCTDTSEKVNENISSIPENEKKIGNNDIVKKKTSNRTKPCIKKSSDQVRRIDTKTGKVIKKLERSLAVNLCLCGGQNKLTQGLHMHKKKTSDIIRKISSFKKSKHLSIISKETASKQNCPNDCVCFHKIPSSTSIDKLLEKLIKWKGEINNSKPTCNKIEDQNNDIKFNSDLSKNINVKKSILKTPEKEGENIICDGHLPEKNIENVIECHSNKEAHEKSTEYGDMLPATTESEYIGEINLDKSNDSPCKCANNKLKYGNGKDVFHKKSFTCINTNVCDCKKSPDINQSQKNSLKNSKIDLKKASQVFSMKFQAPLFKGVENQLQNLNKNESKQSFGISGDSFVGDVLKKSDLFSHDCDYHVKFLGVTLTSTKDLKYNNVIGGHKLISTSTSPYNQAMNLGDKKISKVDINTNVISKLEYEPIDFKYELHRHDTLCDPVEKNKILNTYTTSNVKDEQSICVCCEKKVESNDIELNAFNLLEEHLKEKFAEFQRVSCTSECISAEEEKILFSTILRKVREVISESTNQVSCKCVGLKEESWKRAYGLLQEYLKVKIKRVQCCCSSVNDSNVNTVLPAIMNKVCSLIEKDFQRLKDKCKCKNKTYIQNLVLKDWKEEMTETIINYNDMFVQYEESKNNIRHAKSMMDTSIQALSIPIDNKSCEAMFNDFRLDIAEKKISCELKKGYVTDCSCRNTISEPFYTNKNIYSNRGTESILIKNDKNITSEDTKIVSEKISLLRRASSISRRKQPELADTNKEMKPMLKCPYIGYTLSCSCDRTLGICQCTKSLIETNSEKIDSLWKSFTNEMYSKNTSYIMPQGPTKVKSEHTVNNITNRNLNNNYSSQLKDDKIKKVMCDIDVITSNTDEEIILKDTTDEYGGPDNYSSKNYLSASTDCNEEKHSNRYGNHLQKVNIFEDCPTISELKKNLLYDSLFLPADKFYDCTKYENIQDTETLLPKSEACDCKMVPICHVKMLVDSIERKLIESKCTCDSLITQVCPVHAKEEFQSN